MPRSRGIAVGGREAAYRLFPQWFAFLGVGVVLTVKSAELSPVSWPSGRRTSLFPGGAAAGGAGAGAPRTKAFTALPYPSESTAVPEASRSANPPPVEARPVLKLWSGGGVPA